MTFEVTDRGGGSKGHNSDKIYNCYVNCVDRNVVLNTPVNSIVVTSLNKLDDTQLHELTSDLSSVSRENWCKNFNQDASAHGESCFDMYIPNCANMHDMCSHTVHTLNKVDNNGAIQLNDQYNDHSIIPYMETTISNLLHGNHHNCPMSREFVQQSDPVSI